MGREPILLRQPLTGAIFHPSALTSGWHAVLALLSEGYSPHEGRLLTYYSPVRHFTAPLAEGFSCDLHVLGAPPAFVLSQDQTLD